MLVLIYNHNNSIHSMVFDLQGKHYSLSSRIQPAALPSSTALCKNVILKPLERFRNILPHLFVVPGLFVGVVRPTQRRNEKENGQIQLPTKNLFKWFRGKRFWITTRLTLVLPIFVIICRVMQGLCWRISRRPREIIYGRGEQAGCVGLGPD